MYGTFCEIILANIIFCPIGDSWLLPIGELLDAGVNRSPSAYLNNPSEERARYKYNVDKDMTLLKFIDAQWGPVGSFNWFATHGTSMSRTNSLISGDNKGAAARFMEDWYAQKIGGSSFSEQAELIGSVYNASTLSQLYRRISSLTPTAADDLPNIIASLRSTGGMPNARLSSVINRVRGSFRNTDKPQFVAAFCQSNVGDVSPNVLGAFCTDTGLPCDFNHSTCNGKNELCYGRGPGYPDEFTSTRMIGERQFKKATDLFESATEQLLGKIDYRHVYLDFSKIEVKLTPAVPDNQESVVKTCPAAMGFSFAAGTTDGPGAFDFKQGDDEVGNPFWKLVRDLLKTPTMEQISCQKPKPILLDTGEMSEPYAWAMAQAALSHPKLRLVKVGSVGSPLACRSHATSLLPCLKLNSTLPSTCFATSGRAGAAPTQQGRMGSGEDCIVNARKLFTQPEFEYSARVAGLARVRFYFCLRKGEKMQAEWDKDKDSLENYGKRVERSRIDASAS
eukprot:Gb_04889 [translate_table: standard]